MTTRRKVCGKDQAMTRRRRAEVASLVDDQVNSETDGSAPFHRPSGSCPSVTAWLGRQPGRDHVLAEPKIMMRRTGTPTGKCAFTKGKIDHIGFAADKPWRGPGSCRD